MFENIYPKAASITSILATKSIKLKDDKSFIKLKLKMNNTPTNPVKIDKNFIKVNLSFLVKK